jgi:hypothetical protein
MTMPSLTIAPSRTYHARTEKTDVIRLQDGKSVFKVYYISIIGRDKPELYEWAQCGLSLGDFADRVKFAGLQGVGFITAFPHITKAFRFAPSSETLLHVRAFNTKTLLELSLSREDGYVEFACLAEALIAADEYRAWARCETVADYLAVFSREADMPVANHAKLGAYWGG